MQLPSTAFRCWLLIALFLSLPTATGVARGETPSTQRKGGRPSLFDPSRHMRVSEVKPGMKGYGLSVFFGTEIERFNVEVVSVLEKFNPKHDVILVRCSGANLEHTGSIAGMSGSPIYLVDERGRERLVGAFAYGWPMMKDPVGGVQPIEYMLEIPAKAPTTQPANGDPKLLSTERSPEARAGMPWRVDRAMMMPWSESPPSKYPFASIRGIQVNPRLAMDDVEVARLRPLVTPLMTGGLPSRLLKQLTPIYQAFRLVPLQAGSAGASSYMDMEVELEPGSVMAVPLLTGDVDMTAVGTCTEVIDGRVFGFGHPFMGEGPVELPMAAGSIQAVIANLMTSFKIGSMSKPTGALLADETTGVAGRLGEVPPTVPITLRIQYADGSLDQTYRFNAAAHARFTPILAITAIASALTGEHELPEFHTMDYDLTTRFANGETLELTNTSVNSDIGELFFELGGPMMAASENPFERVLVKEITGTIKIHPQAREARILSVNVPRLKHLPGEMVKAYVTYRPFRGTEATLPIEFELPKDLNEGSYQLTISDWMQFFLEEQTAKPFRFTAESIEEVFEVMRDIKSVRHDALYIRLNRQADGVAIGRTAMPNLPSSRREVIIGAGRSNTMPFVSATVKSVPTEYVMSGAAQFVVTIDNNANVQVGGARGSAGGAQKSEPPADAEPLPEPEKPKSPAPGKGPETPDSAPDASGEQEGETE